MESFATSALVGREARIGTGSESPDCIVYISDCVSCPVEVDDP